MAREFGSTFEFSLPRWTVKREAKYSLHGPVLELGDIPSLIDGSLQITLAYAEEQSRFDLNDIATSAREEGDKFIINGKKSMVLNAESANKLIVVTRTSGGQTEEKGISLFIVDSSADGVVRENFPTVDGFVEDV